MTATGCIGHVLHWGQDTYYVVAAVRLASPQPLLGSCFLGRVESSTKHNNGNGPKAESSTKHDNGRRMLVFSLSFTCVVDVPKRRRVSFFWVFGSRSSRWKSPLRAPPPGTTPTPHLDFSSIHTVLAKPPSLFCLISPCARTARFPSRPFIFKRPLLSAW